MTIRLKLLLFTVLAVLASLLPSLMGLSALQQTQEKLQFINERIVPRLNLCANIRSTFKDLRIDNIYLIYESDATFQSNTRARRLDTISKLNGYLDSYKADAVDDADKARQQNFVSLLGKYNALYDVVLAARSQPAELHRAIEPWRAVGVALGNSVSDMVEAAGRQARQTQQQAEHDFAWAQKVFAGSLLLSMLLLCGFGWLIQRGINRPVRAAVTAVRGIADNQDLSQSVVVSSNDEIGGLLQAFNLLLGKMRLSIQQIGGNAASVTEAAEDLSVASDQVRSGAHMASVSAAEMAAAIEQVTVSISHIAERTRDADQLAAQTGSQVGLGEELIHETVTEIESISSAVHETARYINELQNRTESIGSVVGVISDIADQINLLALNAAIEAARAGESGRGFAVVADEVRKLAERTSASTSTITSTVSSIRDGSSETVELIDNVVNRVEQGVAKVRATGDAIGQLRVLAKQVERQVSDIAAAIQEQSNASGLIAGKVENIAQIAEESSVAADSTAQNAQRLHLLAQDMRRDVACYRT